MACTKGPIAEIVEDEITNVGVASSSLAMGNVTMATHSHISEIGNYYMGKWCTSFEQITIISEGVMLSREW